MAGATLPSPLGRGVGGEGKPRLPEAILSFARENRAHATDAEALMWRLLRNRQFGAKFRRQHPQPPYILDFYCHEHRLAIELDGGQHYTAEGAEADRARSVALQQQGITVLRFSNREVLLETEVVLECVWGRLNSEVALTPTPLTPTPLPEGEGLEDAMLRAAMSAISGIPEAKLDALKLHPSPSGTTTGMSEVEQRLQLLPRGAWGEGSRYDDLAATAALFPDEMEASELGEIPRGWRYSTVGDSFILTMGQSPPGDTYNESGEGLPFYQGRTDFGFRFPSQRVFCTAPTRFAEPDDTLVSVRAPVGDMNMALEKCCLGRGVAGIRHPKGYRSIVFYSLRELRSRFDTFDSEGTVFGSINKKDFQALPVIQPPIEVLAAFERVTTPMDQRVIENEKQIRTLLPKLLSGELPVENLSPESEATV